ncbi:MULTISPECIES: RcnB family protein [Luteimonas]|uniref:Ni/Co efflux regulator RcnB n=1 Tax=Luteimonas terrae TaxID=1530191 RepID=A0ABU1XXR5_9GAMM|nr:MULTISPECIES: RcnB family protein [Luteimonas]MDR6990530.1 Ni/Co efflux regulator RcnB [Luteimonas sp. 3794]MDR7193564.1 Ni/Co efflux regulator RcnB [Luteimonas terrae]
MRYPIAFAATLSALVLISTNAFADPPRHAQGKGPPAHAGTPHGRQGHDRTPPGWEKQAWRRGDRLPLAELDRRYYVDDYRAQRLHAPRDGQRWVRQNDDQYLLIEAATGMILEALSR